MKRHGRNEPIGGGITEALKWFSNATRIPGFLKSFIWDPYNHKTIPNEEQEIAIALQKTYDEKRPNKVGDLVRIPKYDTERYAVWTQPNGQLLITIHGTKLSGSDILDDLKIGIGYTKTDSTELQDLVNEIGKEHKTYDIAAHSLSTEFVQNLDLSNADSIYLYNPASSPLQSTKVLEDRANDPRFTYFINPSDLVSDGLFQQMSQEAVGNSYIGTFNFSPLTAHGLHQWSPDEDNISLVYEEEPENDPEKPKILSPYEIAVLKEKTQ